MSRLIEREPDNETLYPVDIPGYVYPRRSGSKDKARLYFSPRQLKALRANVAKAILKANKHFVESR